MTRLRWVLATLAFEPSSAVGMLTPTSLLAFTTLVPVLLAPVRSAERAPVGQTLDSE